MMWWEVILVTYVAATFAASEESTEPSSYTDEIPVYNTNQILEDELYLDTWDMATERAKGKSCDDVKGTCIWKKDALKSCKGALDMRYKCEKKYFCCITDFSEVMSKDLKKELKQINANQEILLISLNECNSKVDYIIEQIGPTFVGPYDNIWGDEECGFIHKYSGQSLSECKFKCAKSPECTAINFISKDGACILRACKVPVPQPQWNNPPYQGYKIDTGASFIGPYDNIWGDDECGFIKKYYSGQSLSDCEFKCTETAECTAINFNTKDGGCILRACKLPVPQPQWNNPPYQGYKIDTGITFDGPYDNIWGDEQCGFIKKYSALQSLSECKFICTQYTECTAINFNSNGGDCILRACKVPVPQPQWNYPPYQGYKIDTGPTINNPEPTTPAASCDCDFVWLNGCAIVKPAPPGKACECTNTNGSKCKGQVVNCVDPGSQYCKHPDTSCNSCVQASQGNCGGSC